MLGATQRQLITPLPYLSANFDVLGTGLEAQYTELRTT